VSEPRSAPTVGQVVLGKRLQDLRERVGLSRDQAAKVLRVAPGTIRRMETAEVGLKIPYVQLLLKAYGITDAETEAFVELAEEANKPGWWQRFHDVLPDWFSMYVSLEGAASLLRTYEPHFVPGLLQTEDYARNVILVGHQSESADEIDRRVNLRMTRQNMLHEPDAPQFWAVIDEAALSRPFGPPHVMKEQLEHLLEMSELPNVTVQVLPFRFGSHAAAGGAFTILRFAESDLPDIVYLEQLNSAVYLDKRNEVEDYLAVMERVSVQADTPTKSMAMLRQLISDL
jgi:transcriptional regulator with XRE-family HTH domain